ncbi:MAG TPA: hypothetical protein VJV79_30315 [Polyangiaceae bacterium]|nr:hypothetical protein [Polyangiaceae bacterium]
MSASFIRGLLVSALFALGTSSCASERAPINRVQANALEKSFFVGEDLSSPEDNPEFYYRPTIVDVDYGASQDGLFTASYAQTMARTRFEITEDLLLARLTYERIADTTGNGAPNSPNQNSGQIVAAFKIESHFDVKRSYNPTTGEELNIVDENSTDSPWYAREFMRVDWSQNLITSAYQLDTLAAMTAFDGAFRYEPVAYSATTPDDPDRPVFEPNSGYFDITNKIFVTPQKVFTPFGYLPACFLSPDFFGGDSPAGNCNPSEAKVRLSFRRVVDNDYEPVHWDGSRMDMFGMFTTGTLNPDRLGYDRDYGIVDDKWYRFVSRHNIWAKSHAQNDQGEPIPCYTDKTTPVGALPSRDELADEGQPGPDGTDDECQSAGAGSRCDQFSHKCTLPYAARTIKTSPFYYAPESDPTLFDVSAESLAEWDGALRQAAQSARYTECIRLSGGVIRAAIDKCKAIYDPSLEASVAAMPKVFTLCHNPVTADDDPACGSPGLLARVGDLRYHMINLIQKPQTGSPWGIMADAVDPITGEVVAASVNLWTPTTDIAAQGAVDSMRWYLGELSNADISNGNYQKAPVNAALRAPQAASGNPPLLSAADVKARLSALDSRLNDGTQLNPPSPGVGARKLADWAESATRQKFGNLVLGSGNGGIDARMTAARGSPVESQLLTAQYKHLAGLDPRKQANDDQANRASPLRGSFAQFLADFEQQRQVRLAALGRCSEQAPEPTSMADWAAIMDKKFPLTDEDPGTPGVQASAAAVAERNGKWRDFIRRRLTLGILSHELGHSMGLRHQFTSSFDALNFRPQYWQLRTQNGKQTKACTAATTDGETCTGPRWYDPVTQAEREGLIWRWQQTSVMDYPGDLTQDTLGLGAYDRAAVRLEYADVADVWDEPQTVKCGPPASDPLGNPSMGPSCTPNGTALHSLLDGFGGLTGPFYNNGSQYFHYSQLHKQLNLVRDCQPADTNPPADWDEAKNGVYSPEFDGEIVAGTVCKGIPTDYVPFRELSPDAGGFTQEPGIGDNIQRNYDALGRVRRPYMFGTDNYADIGNLPVLRHDNGADAYEVAHYLISEYEDRYVFDAYRRNRTTFSLRNAFMRGYNRYNTKLKEVTKGFALYNELFQATGQFAELTAEGAPLQHSALAASLVFDHFARILTRPTSGAHFSDTSWSPFKTAVMRSTDQNPAVNTVSGVNLLVPDGTTGVGRDASWGGRLLNNSYDQSKGYYAVEYQLNVGSYYDKSLAVYMLTDSEDRFISQSRDDFQDGRYRNTSFATLFPDGMRRLLANTLTEDEDIKGWRVAATKGVPNVDAQGALTQPMGFRSWWPKDELQTCWPTQGRLYCHAFPSDAEVTNGTPAESLAVDPEVGFEIHKFITFFSMLNLPESWKLNWVDMMRIWLIGVDASPGFPDSGSVAWRDPQSGQLYLAHSYGTEEIDGKTVQRGIAARVLEWMNTLTAKAYSIDETVVNPTGELSVLRYTDNSACPPGVSYCIDQPIQIDAAFALRVTNYKSVIDYMHMTAAQFGFYGPNWRGVY